jgi:EF-hand domain-containing protein 1
LRFDAYFQEHVVEDPNENYRVRKCEIYYYLTDGTVYITEPKIENSGLPQGVFLKRQKVPKSMEDQYNFISWEDFNLAFNLTVYERVFRIVDCDDFTKQYYQSHGVTLNRPEEMPTDKFEYLSSIKDLKIPPPDTKEYKEYFEVKLKGGHPNGGLQKYLENDRKVLQFDVVWDDKTLEGGLKFYKLNFFLADDTVEVKENKDQNSGKDPFPLLLRRAKLPKVALLTHYPGMNLKKEEYYRASDLSIGTYVNIYSRPCFIYGCDDFTRKWFKDK